VAQQTIEGCRRLWDSQPRPGDLQQNFGPGDWSQPMPAIACRWTVVSAWHACGRGARPLGCAAASSPTSMPSHHPVATLRGKGRHTKLYDSGGWLALRF
jgi:hypothetical protein